MTQAPHKKIIVVDDSLESLTAIKNTLKDLYDVYPAPITAKMFDLLEHFIPDLILLDIEMPNVSGFEAAKMLKSSDVYGKIPVVFLTAHGRGCEGEGAGALGCIYKPFTAPLLLERVKMILA